MLAGPHPQPHGAPAGAGPGAAGEPPRHGTELGAAIGWQLFAPAAG